MATRTSAIEGKKVTMTLPRAPRRHDQHRESVVDRSHCVDSVQVAESLADGNNKASDFTGLAAASVKATGYTDDLGSAAHGRTLSRQRADAVAKVLRRTLPAADLPFTVRGRGEADPAVPSTSEKNRRVNRRVVLVYAKR